MILGLRILIIDTTDTIDGIGGERAKRPNRAKRHCPFHLMPQALHIKCPSFYPETASTLEDNEGTARGRV